MQIFIPLANLDKLFQILDRQRLGKQRVECKQVLDIILGRSTKKGWKSHPAIKMWAPYSEFLKLYFNKCVAEWTKRGYKNNMELEVVSEDQVVIPSFWGDEELHATHRANLLRKDSEFYSRFGWTEAPRNGYLWVIGNKRILVDNTAKKVKRAAEGEGGESATPVKRTKGNKK